MFMACIKRFCKKLDIGYVTLTQVGVPDTWVCVHGLGNTNRSSLLSTQVR